MNRKIKIDLISGIKKYAEENQDRSPRFYLGASDVGHVCKAKSWLTFRMATNTKYDAETLFKFEDGFNSEDITIKRIERIPLVKLIATDSQGGQFGFQALGGHLKGHIDGIIVIPGPREDFKAIWENKCVNEASFKKLQNLVRKSEVTALEKWNWQYYVQAQLYMHFFDLKYHITTVATAGSRNYTAMYTDYDPETANEYINISRRIIDDDTMPLRVSQSGGFPCTYCNHKAICYDDAFPQINCRTCIFSYPITEDCKSYDKDSNDLWMCTRHKKKLSPGDQLEGCKSHLYQPQMLAPMAAQVDYAPLCIKYERRIDGKLFENRLDENGASNSFELVKGF